MVAQPRFTPHVTDQGRANPVTRPLAPADTHHEGIESPAIALQARLDVAMSTGRWAGSDAEPRVDRWSGATRVAVLLGGAGASWAIAWKMVEFLLPA